MARSKRGSSVQPASVGFLLALVVAVSAGCASPPIHGYKLYPGPEHPASELATLRLAGVGELVVDGLTVRSPDYQLVYLQPGRHRIQASSTFGFSVMVEPEMLRTFTDGFDVELAAGHTYEVHSDRTTGHGYQIYFWVEDAADGSVIAGTRKP